MAYHRNRGLRKVCRCGWRQWPKCPHSWYVNFTTRDGRLHRFSLDAQLEKHIGSKADAEHEADLIRTAIRNGTFVPVAKSKAARAAQASPPADGVEPETALTFRQFAEIYVNRVAKAGLKGHGEKATWKNDESRLRRFSAFLGSNGVPLGDRDVSTITEDDVETFFASLAPTFAVSTRNHYVQVLSAAFRWAARKGYRTETPISDDSAIKRGKVAQRRRRLLPDEETRLLAAAGRTTRASGLRLQWPIIAAIETGCRRGELLALRWVDVNTEKRTLFVRAVEEGAKKTARARSLPISARLAGVLEMALAAAKAKETAERRHYVFGDETGARVLNTKRAWATAVLKSHGYTPEWSAGKLAATSRAVLNAIDLHFHDLRHEAGCRWLEAGLPLHHIQEMLGHTNLAQTSTYLHASECGLMDSMKRFDESRKGKPLANTEAIDHEPLCQSDEDTSDKPLIH